MSKLTIIGRRFEMPDSKAMIIGTVERLLVLRQAIEQAITQSTSSVTAQDEDGEQYQIIITTIREK